MGSIYAMNNLPPKSQLRAWQGLLRPQVHIG